MTVHKNISAISQTLALFIIFSFLLFNSSCFKAKPVEVPTEGLEWQKIPQYRATDLILNLHGTPFEVYAITDSEFARFNGVDTLLEKRPFSPERAAIGRPIMNDNSFVRYVNEDGKDAIEFHLTRQGGGQHRIVVDDLKEEEDNKVDIDVEARQSGAFNKEGTQFVLLTIVNFKYTAFYFDIVYNMTHDEIISVTPSHRVDINLEEGEDQLQVVRFIEGNYYLATKKGAYRLTPDGIATQPISEGHWVLDFFGKDSRIYATGFNSYEQRTSLDNGLSFQQPIGEDSDLQEIEVVGDTLFTHQSLGFPYKMVLPNLLDARDIQYPQGIDVEEGDNNSFYGICYSNGKFYISHEKEIYYVDQVNLAD